MSTPEDQLPNRFAPLYTATQKFIADRDKKNQAIANTMASTKKAKKSILKSVKDSTRDLQGLLTLGTVVLCSPAEITFNGNSLHLKTAQVPANTIDELTAILKKVNELCDEHDIQIFPPKQFISTLIKNKAANLNFRLKTQQTAEAFALEVAYYYGFNAFQKIVDLLLLELQTNELLPIVLASLFADKPPYTLDTDCKHACLSYMLSKLTQNDIALLSKQKPTPLNTYQRYSIFYPLIQNGELSIIQLFLDAHVDPYKNSLSEIPGSNGEDSTVQPDPTENIFCLLGTSVTIEESPWQAIVQSLLGYRPILIEDFTTLRAALLRTLIVGLIQQNTPNAVQRLKWLLAHPQLLLEGPAEFASAPSFNLGIELANFKVENALVPLAAEYIDHELMELFVAAGLGIPLLYHAARSALLDLIDPLIKRIVLIGDLSILLAGKTKDFRVMFQLLKSLSTLDVNAHFTPAQARAYYHLKNKGVYQNIFLTLTQNNDDTLFLQALFLSQEKTICFL